MVWLLHLCVPKSYMFKRLLYLFAAFSNFLAHLQKNCQLFKFFFLVGRDSNIVLQIRIAAFYLEHSGRNSLMVYPMYSSAEMRKYCGKGG